MPSSLDLVEPADQRSAEWWRLAARELWALWLGRPKLSKRAVLAVAWTYTPRKLKLAAAGVTALVLVFAAGALALVVLAFDALLR
jgi:hypothetical protein